MMKYKRICIGLMVLLLLLVGCNTDIPAGSPSNEQSETADETLLPPQQSAEYNEDESMNIAQSESESTSTETYAPQGVYLGVADYGGLKADQMDSFRYRFFIDGEEQSFQIVNDWDSLEDPDACLLQNQLQEGGIYRIIEEKGFVTALEPVEAVEGVVLAAAGSSACTVRTDAGIVPLPASVPCWRIILDPGSAKVENLELIPGLAVRICMKHDIPCAVYVPVYNNVYKPPVSGEPGVRTIGNLLKTAMMPVGTTLYIYGGAWDWQDHGAAPQARHIGLPVEWVTFFRTQTEAYTYKDTDPKRSYFPYGGWNEYYYAGADCSGYLGWVLYNTFYSTEDEPGLVTFANRIAAQLESFGCGIVLRENIRRTLHPGDIMSMAGHCWLCLGVCEDGSAVIVHSSPTTSRTGSPGGGVQLSALGYEGCDAYILVKDYMERFYPDWYARYSVRCFDPAAYLAVTDGTTGLFQWMVGETEKKEPGPLSDPEGIRELSAAEVLCWLFGD